MRAWLTPNIPPCGIRHIDLVIPRGYQWEAIARGAFAPLLNEANFESAGAITPEEAAQAFRDTMLLTMSWTDCGDDSMARVVGALFGFLGDTPPVGALACDGSEVAQDDYPDLYAIVGDVWGSAGAGNFLLPDLRARMLVGSGPGPGLTDRDIGDSGGVESFAYDDLSVLPYHRHSMANHKHTVHHHPDGLALVQAGSGAIVAGSVSGTEDSGTPVSNNSLYAGTTDPIPNMPPYAAILWCVWAEP